MLFHFPVLFHCQLTVAQEDGTTKVEKVTQTEMKMVKQTIARWKDRRLLSGGFLFEGGIPILEGSDPGKVVQKVPISPWV